jgi:hypothetical protein
MKTLEFIYQETEIHFLVNPLDKNVMVNATEMAKLFDRRTKDFLKTDHAKDFIEVAKRALNGAQIIDDRGRNGIYFNKRLALKFAAWLSPEFEYWIYSTIDEIVFGNYKKHWEAHAHQEHQKTLMENIKTKMLLNPTPEMVAQYFEYEREHNLAKSEKTKAIRNQLKLFGAE